MWLFTRYGFFSVACADGPDGAPDPEKLMIRAQREEHLRRLQDRFAAISAAGIITTPNRDYRFRIVVAKESWVTILAEMAREQTWSNFKSEVAKFQGQAGVDYVHRLHSVWSTMYSLQSESPAEPDAGGKQTRPAAATDYADIFRKAEGTLISEASKTLGADATRRELNEYKFLGNETWTDDDYFRKLVHVTFYSGFSAETVDKHLRAIDKYLLDYRVTAAYGEDDVDRMMADTEMIRHQRKIRACVKNARTFRETVAKHGCFQRYVDSFAPHSSFEHLMKLRLDLRRRFEYLSGITSLHFMMDIGLPVLKPDRAVTRIFFRLGLIDNEHDDETQRLKAIQAGHRFAQAVNEPIRYIDIVFASYGQVNTSGKVLQQGICLKNGPRCTICELQAYCKYFSTTLRAQPQALINEPT
jgi:DNA-3-methyladenine glycosylase I